MSRPRSSYVRGIISRTVFFSWPIVFLIFAIIHPQSSSAQTSPEVMDVRPYAPLHGTDLETVSLMNGTLSVHIPVWSIPQRGKVKLDFTLAYHDISYSQNANCERLTRPPTQCTAPPCPPPSMAACGVSWGLAGSVEGPYDQFGIHIAASTDVGLYLQYGDVNNTITGIWFQLRTPDGGSHKLTATSAGDWRAADGTGWEYQTSNCTARDNEGTEYVYACNPEPTSGALYPFTHTYPGDLLYVEDTNGNRITLNYESDNNAFLGWTDSVGRSIPPFYSAPSTSTANCPSGSTAAQLWQIPGVSPGIVICQTAVQLQTAFLSNTQLEDPDQYSEDTRQLATVSGVILPSGDMWSFSYAPSQGDPDYGTQRNGVQVNFGDIRQINFPTGGSVHYIWGRQGGICGMGYAQQNNSVLASRTIQYPQGSPELWTYSFYPTLPSAASQAYQATVTDPYGNVSIHSITDLGGCSYYETSNAIYDNANNLYETIKTDYQALPEAPFIEGSSIVGFGALPIATHAIWPDGTSKTTAWTYDSGFQSNQTPTGNYASLSYGNKITETSYNFGSGTSPGSSLRASTMDYWAFDNPSAFSANILAPLSSVITTDSITGATQQTTYGYDETGLGPGNASQTVGSPPITIWDPSPPNGSVRGNQTSVARYLNTTNSSLTTKVGYNNTGTIASISLPENSPYPDTTTTYGYSGTYQGAYLSSVTNTLNQSKTYAYDLTTGELSTATDENQQVTTYSYYPDTRLQSVVGPAVSGGNPETDYSYPSSNEVDSQTRENASTWIQKKSLFDGLGRISHQETLNGCSGGDYITVDTTYDLDERVFSVSNPHCGQSTSASDGIIYHGTPQGSDGYDPLGRPTLVTDADEVSTQAWSYQDDTTTYRDEAGSSWSRTNDALGRLGTVVEPGGLQTTYGYDGFGNLVSTNQGGNSNLGEIPRTRGFSYDSLSRLTASSNPETGNISFSYDAHSNLQYKTDAIGTVSKYSYDALNRVIEKDYSDGTRSEWYGYDGKDEGGNSLGSPFNTNAVGRLSHTSDNIHIASNLGYDAMGRLTLKNDCLESDCSYSDNQSATYDLAGNLTSLTYPDGRVVNQTWDGVGRLLTVSDATPGGSNGTYLNVTQYWPNGAVNGSTYGNGLSQNLAINSRLQPTGSVANWTNLSLLNRQVAYTNSGSNGCTQAANNGNVYSRIDNLQPGNTEYFCYDILNRLTSAYRTDNAYNHSYSYDSFGNMSLQDNLSNSAVKYESDPAGTNRLLRSHDGGTTWNDLVYDASGALTQSSDGINPTNTYQHNAMGQLLSIDGGTDSYLYDAWDQRAFKWTGNGTTDYIYFNGQPIADKDQNGNWTDYIYANGQKIARTTSSEGFLQVSGNAGSGGYWQYYNTNGLQGYFIQPGDRLSWRQYSSTTADGGILIQTNSGGNSAWTLYDSNGVVSNQSGTTNAWEYRTADLSQFEGQEVTVLAVGLELGTSGTASIDFADMALLSTDGTVRTVFNGQSIGLTPWTWNNGMPNGAGVFTTTAPAGSSLLTDETAGTHYYIDDHLGSTQMELSSGGWPVWSGQFTPFGQEIVSGQVLSATLGNPQPGDGTTMHYKFTGKERDSESGLDYFGARYYASNVGRWVSPDWSGAPVPVAYANLANPQSLNLYAYVGNNPLSKLDPDGHAEGQIVTDGAGNTFCVGGPCRVQSDDPLARGYLATHSKARTQQSPSLFSLPTVHAQEEEGPDEAIEMQHGSALEPIEPSPTMGMMGRVFDAMHPGPLPEDIAKTFSGGQYVEFTAGKDGIGIDNARVYGGKAGPLGRNGTFFSTEPQVGGIQSTIDYGLRPEYGNTAGNTVCAYIPPGTTVYLGQAANQGGAWVAGKIQIYVPPTR